MKNGWPKIILRDLMEDRLPDEVRWCRGKPHLGWLFNTAVTEYGMSNGRLSISKLQAVLNDYVEPKTLASAWEEFRHSGDCEKIYTAFVLSNWLQENRDRPIVKA